MGEHTLTEMATAVAEMEATGDRRVIFLECYRMMTANVLTAVNEGRFHDGPWVARLLHRFADYYFEALACYNRGEPCAAVWQQTFDAAREEAHVLQHLFLGVNAHINYDLTLCLVDMLQPEWGNLDEAGRMGRYRDHTLINELIAGTIDAVQDEVVEPRGRGMALLDWLGGPLDEWLTAKLISRWREEVWETAVHLLQAKDAAARSTLRRRLAQRTLQRGRRILGDLSAGDQETKGNNTFSDTP